MKIFNINRQVANIFFVLFLFIFSACEKYKPVYQYSENEKITATGLEALYQVTSGNDVLTIDPTISSNKTGDLKCVWGIYETNTQGTNPVMDTLARTKKLEYKVNRSAKDWYLMLRVTNSRTGYSQYFKSTVRVGTIYTRGWYIPKDDGSQTDMDFFATPATSSMPSNNTKIENVYSLMQGKKLEGKAIMLSFFVNFKSMVNGSYVSTRSLSLVSEKDVSMMDLSNLQVYRNFDNIFQAAPTPRKMDVVTTDFLKYFLINNGQLYSMVGQGYSEGIFGGRKLLTSNDNPYHLSKHQIIPSAGTAYFFDEMSSAFYAGTDRSLYLGAVTINTARLDNNPVTPASAAATNKKLIYMGNKVYGSSGGGAPGGYVIFQDKTNPTIKTMYQVGSAGPNGLTLNAGVTISTASKLFNATHYGLLFGDENLLYFSSGKEIYSYNLNSNTEQLQYTVPNDEEITFIRHRKLTGADAYNYVMIGTQSGQNYKVRLFNKTTGNLNTEPSVTLTGKGRPVDALYVSPTVTTELVYSYTF
ncbi:PKD-like family lipoprotein [Pedobacter sp. UBA4863]|uniref:PKD-like family lipoprotein n=1 Tax=Pedobacter sp. UBA4863 TaxID=1947060 RepID=UPI0025CEEF05|nr:PKD-like family lipoprotein [Pedobacter sp. UBA4863]